MRAQAVLFLFMKNAEESKWFLFSHFILIYSFKYIDLVNTL
jgi:hypothetical protein